MSARLRLRRTDGKLFLERWGFECKWFGVFLHHIEAPDPGQDLHMHPWYFESLILKGGYTEVRNGVAWACDDARASVLHRDRTRGEVSERKRWSWKALHLDECHTITDVHGDTWTLVFRGRKRSDREWGFFTPKGFVSKTDYETPDRPLVSEKV